MSRRWRGSTIGSRDRIPGADGPRFRYILPGAEGWRTSDAWPLPGVAHQSLALRIDGMLGKEEGESGSRTLMALGAGLNRAKPSETDPPSSLSWDSEPLRYDLDVVGDIEVQPMPFPQHPTQHGSSSFRTSTPPEPSPMSRRVP